MENLDLIVENYKRLSTEDLVAIAKEPSSLDIQIIPHLQSELFSRNKKEEALELSQFLIQRPKLYTELSKEELREIITSRIESGEPLESIKLDLQDKGIDMLDLLEGETKSKNKVFEYLTSLKEDNLDETEINEKMQSTFGITEDETDVIKRQLRTKGKYNLIIGYTIVIAVTILSIASLTLGGSITIGAILTGGLGIWLISEGHRQRK